MCPFIITHAAITRTYDPAGRQLSETQLLTGGLTGTFQYQYDGDGNLSRHIRPDGSIVDYAWNARNMLAAVTSDGPPPVATYTYNGRSQISSTIVENGIFTANRTYDAAGRLTGVTNGAIENTGYTLSSDGRRTSVTRDGDVENYEYDNARQVTSASYGGLSTNQSWNYDAAGNRSSATTNGLTTNYVANAVNEYTSISGLPTNPAHDDNGNATTWNIRPPSSGILASASFYWDINNQLIAATDNNTGDSAAYQYDALGRRTKRTEILGGVATETWFFSNGWNVELERNATNFKKRMTWGLDLSQSLQGAGGVGGLVMVEDLTSGTSNAYFPTYDGNGNITAWVNASGTVVAHQRYDAFGNIIAQTGTAPSNYGFSTKPMDQVTGLLYYGYRYYDPVTGRWPSRDPIGERGGVNLYGFVGNDGVNAWDYLGFIGPNQDIMLSEGGADHRYINDQNYNQYLEEKAKAKEEASIPGDSPDPSDNWTLFTNDGDYLDQTAYFDKYYPKEVAFGKFIITEKINEIIKKGCPGRRLLITQNIATSGYAINNWVDGVSVGSFSFLVTGGVEVNWDGLKWSWKEELLITDTAGFDWGDSWGENIFAALAGWNVSIPTRVIRAKWQIEGSGECICEYPYVVEE